MNFRSLGSFYIRYIRRWIEVPVSFCIKEWLVSPSGICGMGIPSFLHHTEILRLGKRSNLKKSKIYNVRALSVDSSKSNINSDSLLLEMPIKEAVKQ